MKIKWFTQFFLSDQCFNDTLDLCFNDTLDLLLISNHYVYIKDFNRLMLNINKCKIKKGFV